MLKPLDVIWTFDGTIAPPGPKRIVCVEPALGYFFRINTKPKWQTPVLLRVKDYPEFLKHDSYIECGEPLELDEYSIDEALRGRGIIGSISHVVGKEICRAVCGTPTLAKTDKDAITKALGYPCDTLTKPTA